MAALWPAIRPLLPWRAARRLLRLALFVIGAATLLAATLAGAIMVTAAHAPAPDVGSTTPAPPSWVDVNRPITVYDLTGTEFAKLPRSYRARRHLPDGAREDVLTFGERGSAKPYLSLSLVRLGADGGGPASRPIATRESFDDDLARLAGDGNASISRLGTVTGVETRFGPVEVADLLLSAGGRASPCLGFRGNADRGDVLRLAGFACGSRGRPIGRAALACVVDRLDLVSAAADGPLRAVFVAAERRPGAACHGGIDSAVTGESDPAAFLVSPGHRGNWLDPDATMPALRADREKGTRIR